MRRRALRGGLVVAAVVALAGGWAAAGIIGPGVDYMKTQPASEWHLMIEGGGFGPGSDPFEGQVAVYTDTLVGRGASVPITDALSLIPTELVALQLHSVEPIAVSYRDGGATGARYTRLFDVVVALTADVPWCSTAPAPYYREAAGGFFPGFSPPLDGRMPLRGPAEPQTLVFQGQSFTWHLRLEPVPEPATLGLLALGGLGALCRRRRRAP